MVYDRDYLLRRERECREAAERAAALFGALLTSNGVTATLARPNRQRFRANLVGLLRGVTAANLVLPR